MTLRVVTVVRIAKNNVRGTFRCPTSSSFEYWGYSSAGERRVGIAKVKGSIPFSSTIEH